MPFQLRAAFKNGSALTFLLILLQLQSGCANGKQQGSPAAHATTQPAAVPASASDLQQDSADAETVRQRLTNTSDGLELRRWTIIDEPGRVMTALTKYAAGAPIDPTTHHQLKRNGFRFVRVRADQLDSLLAELGGANVDASEWHGQAPEWRSILSRSVGATGRAIAIDGLVRRYEGGEFRLMMRSWTVQMEDGTYVHLEMLPRRAVPQANDLRRLLGEELPAGQAFGSMAMDLQLQAGFAYVLVSESPRVDWPGVDPEEDTSIQARAGTAQPQAAAGGRRAPDEGFGPDALPPPTLGELLLAPELEPPRRSILVFVPKISPELLLPGQMEQVQRQQVGQRSPMKRETGG